MFQQFLSELCSKLKQRYDNFSVDLIKYLSCFHSKNALNPHYHEGAYENLDVLFYELPLLTNNHDGALMIQINKEWSGLSSYNIPEYLKEEENADIFWARVKNIVNEEGIYIFRNIAEFALNVLSLPISNAPSERIWSELNRQKDNSRASLLYGTIRGIVQATLLKRLILIYVNLKRLIIIYVNLK